MLKTDWDAIFHDALRPICLDFMPAAWPLTGQQARDLVRITDSKVKTAIITGANGFIGSHLVCRLLAQGWRVQALGRSTNTCAWVGRVSAALREIAAVDVLSGRLECFDVDLNSINSGLRTLIPPDSTSEETFLFNVAGDTRFKPTSPEPQRRINVQAALELVSTFKDRISRLVHVSTAYAAGKRSGLIRETELDCGQDFWNSYEKSKFDAEVALTNLCRQEGIPLVIVRPAIIVNDRKSGHASTFTHLNALVEVVSRLQDYYDLADGQVVSKAIRLLADPQARPNLAPIDSITPPLLQIAESPAAPGKTFHLCHPQPQTNSEIMALICEAYNVKDLVKLEFVEHFSAPMSHTEEMVARSLKVYSPYLNSRLEFDLSNARSLVADYDANFSPLDVDYIRRVIQFQRNKRK